MDLARLVERSRRRVGTERPVRRDLGRLGLRLGPGPPEPRHLRAVDPAEPGERRLRRQRLAPRARGLAPLARPPDVRELQTGLEHVAVDRAGEERAQLPRHDRGHRLVEQGQTLGHPAARDEEEPLRVDRRRDEVAVSETTADAGRALRQLGRALEVAARPGLDGLGEREEPVLRALLEVAEVSLRALDPSRGHRRLPADEVLDPEAHGHERRRRIASFLRVPRVRALPCGDRFVRLGEPPGGVGEPLEVARGQVRRIDRPKCLVRLEPLVPPDRVARPLDVGDPLGHVVCPRSCRPGLLEPGTAYGSVALTCPEPSPERRAFAPPCR